LGITEPAMFGINLKLRYPFIAAITGSALGSAYVAFNQVKSVALGAAGLPGIISIRTDCIIHYITGMAISMLATFALTLMLAKRFEQSQRDETVSDTGVA